MKRLLLLHFALPGFLCVWAQNPEQDRQKLKNVQVYQNALTTYLHKQNSRSDTIVILPGKPHYLVNPKPGVHRLPQDNMPCIVPDPRATVAIPNLWKGEKKVPFKGWSPRIPNPAKPLKLAPSRH